MSKKIILLLSLLSFIFSYPSTVKADESTLNETASLVSVSQQDPNDNIKLSDISTNTEVTDETEKLLDSPPNFNYSSESNSFENLSDAKIEVRSEESISEQVISLDGIISKENNTENTDFVTSSFSTVGNPIDKGNSLNFKPGEGSVFFSADRPIASGTQSVDLFSSLDYYISRASDGEKELFRQAKTRADKEKVISFIISNQINEEYALLELEELHKYLSTEEIEKLNQITDLATYQKLLESHFKSHKELIELEALVDFLLLDSKPDELERLMAVKSEQELRNVLLEMVNSRQTTQQSSNSSDNFRASAAILGYPLVFSKASTILKGAALLGKTALAAGLPVLPAVVGVAAVAGTVYVGYKLYQNYQQNKISSKDVNRSVKQTANQRIMQRANSVKQTQINSSRREQAVSQISKVVSTGVNKAVHQYHTNTTVTSIQQVQRNRAQAVYGALGLSNASVGNLALKNAVSTNPSLHHIVKPGESVWSISHTYGISMAQLVAWNGIVNNTIHPKQSLIVSVSTPKSVASSDNYIVKSGDTLWAIANRHKLSVSELKALNGLTGDIIQVGQQLKLTSSQTTYTVKSGDTLWAIANRHKLSVSELKSLNGLTGDIIQVGQQLKLTSSQTTYTVKSGDTLWAIANRHKLSVSELKSLNGLTGDIIQVGQQLKLTSSQTTYTVKSGDTLWAIANRHKLTVDELKRINGIVGNVIQIGQILSLTPNNTNISNSQVAKLNQSNGAYIVQIGDTLKDIADYFNISITTVRQLNNLKNDTITVGQVLKVAPRLTTISSTGDQTYRVQKGDSLWGIATYFGIKLEKLIAWNDLVNNTIRPGQELVVKKITTLPQKPTITAIPPRVDSGPVITSRPPTVASAPKITTTPLSNSEATVTGFPLVENQPIITKTPLTAPTTETISYIELASHFINHGQLKPNVSYRTGEYGYLYQTDALGRIIVAEASQLQIKTHTGRLNHNPNTLDKLIDDHAGHIFADLFGGSPALDNLISQAKGVNQREYRALERTWYKAIKEGKTVEVSIKLIYEGSSKRPIEFDIEYKIDGRVTKKNIENK